jgi:hypothetical protein
MYVFTYRFFSVCGSTGFLVFGLVLVIVLLRCLRLGVRFSCSSTTVLNQPSSTYEPPLLCLPVEALFICDTTDGRMALRISLCQLRAVVFVARFVCLSEFGIFWGEGRDGYIIM